MSNSAVLVVDDNPANLKLIRVLLTANGFDVRTAANAEEAQATLRSCNPGIILMDLQLPGMDGLELTRRLKRDPKTAGITIIAVTAYAMKNDDQRALASGCDDYVTKPIDVDTLPVLVSAWFEKRAQTQRGGVHEG